MIKDLTRKPESQSESADEASTVSDSSDTTIVDASETTEFVDKLPGESGEKSSEDDSQSSGSGATAQDDGTDAAALEGIEAMTLPPRNVMKREVRNALIKEEGRLRNEASQYSRQGDYFELNNVLAKIREIRFTLAELVRATYENLKSLWLKYVYKTK
ncbi:hypothetical protein COW94_01985 [Candidatus Peregrinibacteria bacterium CG22_combo_CG10-13_8_21_14_all_44_10]|nr:MAG: hypothetical protein AUK45_00555 [Candidatus Peregrinibacteria bacterium CG2_30_44_17]PIP66398.1 MAG: hypothetical protein COW94_01985 [Candidatus Peregrinibacteria bacterium CG22_combo_CG10-13_8_21_14_all_44_10]PIS03493.1 MAG: hypothetical protein COT83_05785 [Candidatus Peregrinibacteria bacterium CG10_big_fil_rev_8_21_14_0_10_44_7]PIX80219.1 MAG: hypothetical protein COZ35_01410 [Candidatus Peregrinibacteria bacterium CG_4_10_14_3_um_filter_44_21]PJB88897.1 MAG: hypothetical protein 